MRDQWSKTEVAPRAGFEPATIRLTVEICGFFQVIDAGPSFCVGREMCLIKHIILIHHMIFEQKSSRFR